MPTLKTNLFKEIIKNEGLIGWKVRIEKDGGGIVIFKTKTIFIGEKATMAMFLHEVSHAIAKEGHTGIFADKFTQLVDKYKKIL